MCGVFFVNLHSNKSLDFIIFALIDYKVENDMQQVLSKMEILVNKMDNIEKHLESQMDIQFKMILWVLGILGLLITVFKFVG